MNRLARSRNDRVLLGVCGGIGEYFRVDSTIIRLGFVFLLFVNFSIAAITYIIAAFVMPDENDPVYDEYDEFSKERQFANTKVRKNTSIALGIGLIILGAYLLMDIFIPNFLYGLRYQLGYIWRLWPVLLIMLGIYIIFKKRDYEDKGD